MNNIERILLSNFMDDRKKLYFAINSGMQREDFINPKSRLIFDLIVKADKEKGTTNAEMVAHLSTKEGKVAISEVTELSDYNLIEPNITQYLKELYNLKSNFDIARLCDSIKDGSVSINEAPEAFKRIELSKNRLIGDSLMTTMDKVKYIDSKDLPKIPTGFEFLDALLKGFYYGTLNVLAGYSGAGKSTILNQLVIAQSLKAGEKIFCYSGELTNGKFKNWLYPTLADGEQFKDGRMIGSAIKSLDNFVKLNDNFYIVNDKVSEMTEELLFRSMEYCIRKGVKVFVIDNLMKIELENEFKSELIAQKKFINRLKEFANKHQAIVHLVAHFKKPDGNRLPTKYDIAGSSTIANLADTILSIRRLKESEVNDAKENPDRMTGEIVILKDRDNGSNDKSFKVKLDNCRKRFYGITGAQLRDRYINYKSAIEVTQNDAFK